MMLEWQCPLLAPSACVPQMVCVCVCVCVHAWLHVCVCVCTERTWSIHCAGISTYRLILYYASTIHKHTHARILKPFEDSEPMGLKVDIAIGILFFNHLNTTTLIYIYIFYIRGTWFMCTFIYVHDVQPWIHKYHNERQILHACRCVCVCIQQFHSDSATRSSWGKYSEEALLMLLLF